MPTKFLKEIVELDKEYTISSIFQIKGFFSVVGWVSKEFSDTPKNSKISLEFSLSYSDSNKNDTSLKKTYYVDLENITDKDHNGDSWVFPDKLNWTQHEKFNKIIFRIVDNNYNIKNLLVLLYFYKETEDRQKLFKITGKTAKGESKIKFYCTNKYGNIKNVLNLKEEDKGYLYQTCLNYIFDNKQSEDDLKRKEEEEEPIFMLEQAPEKPTEPTIPGNPYYTYNTNEAKKPDEIVKKESEEKIILQDSKEGTPIAPTPIAPTPIAPTPINPTPINPPSTSTTNTSTTAPIAPKNKIPDFIQIVPDKKQPPKSDNNDNLKYLIIVVLSFILVLLLKFR